MTKLKHKSEMNKLIWWFVTPVFILVAIILGFFLIDGIMSSNNNAKHAKQLLIDQTVESYRRLGENFQSMNFDQDVMKLLKQDFIEAFFEGDVGPAYDLIMNITVMASPADYVALVEDGNIYDYSVKPGVTVDPEELLTNPPPNDYKIVESFGNKKGTLLYAFYPIDLSVVGLSSEIYISSVFDLTSQVEEIDAYFRDQRNDDIIKLAIAGLVALLFFSLLSVFWLRYLIKKYIAEPMERLNTMAEEISAGAFDGEVEVDESSDFAALQGLLRSGQLILRKHDQDLDKSVE